MGKEIAVAKMTANGKLYVGKREYKTYDESSKVDAQLLSDANVGLKLRIQRNIREAVKVKHGLKTVSSGGESVDLSAIESV